MPRIGLAASLLAFAAPAFATPTGNGVQNPSGEIAPTPVIGGTAVPAGKWPDAVAVLGQGSCTGTLIAPDVVLTAGHCADAGMTTVIADTTNYNATGGKRAT